MTTLSPVILNVLQRDLANQFASTLTWVSGYAVHLLYLLAGLELAIMGLIWIVKQENTIGDLLFTLLKIGFVIFIVTQYSFLLNTLLAGFISVGNGSTSQPILELLTQPVHLFQYNYDVCINAIAVGMQYGTYNIGASLLYLFLGLGALIGLIVIAAQLILVNIAFYAVALMGLMIIPFSVLRPAGNLLSKIIQNLLQAGMRILVMLLLLSVLMTLSTALNIKPFVQGQDITPLISFFMVILIVTFLSLKLPRMAADTVGQFVFNRFFNNSDSNVIPLNNYLANATTQAIQNPAAAQVLLTNLQAATSVSANGHSSIAASALSVADKLRTSSSSRIVSPIASTAEKWLSHTFQQQLKKTVLEALAENWQRGK